MKVFCSCEIIFSSATLCAFHNMLQHSIITMVLRDYQNAQIGAFSNLSDKYMGTAYRAEGWQFWSLYNLIHIVAFTHDATVYEQSLG